MKNLKLLILITFTYSTVYSQPHRSDNWYFGSLAGITFTNGTPSAITNGSMVTNEGCAAISDTTGIILFYTDGVSVWNKNNTVMPNGSGLMGDASSTQSAVIVTKPGSNTEHYIFTMEELGDPDGFRYSIVDMNLNGGVGDVTAQKNIFINTYMTEKLTAVQQLGTPNFWIATHKWGNSAFYVYSLTTTGLQPTPIVSNVGIVHKDSAANATYGQMKFNVCGNKIALAAGYLDTVEVFDFDNATGAVSNPITLPMGYHVYGVEFSKNSRFLYVTNYNPSATLVQFDLSSGNAATIIASKTVISNTADMYGLQLANDNKIYASRTVSAWLGVINSPETAGVNCNYVDNGVNLDPNGVGIYSLLGLPALTASYLRGETFCNTNTTIEESVNTDLITINPSVSGNQFVLSLNNSNPKFEFSIYNTEGRLIDHQTFFKANATITFGKELLQGIYFVELKTENRFHTKRIVKL